MDQAFPGQLDAGDILGEEGPKLAPCAILAGPLRDVWAEATLMSEDMQPSGLSPVCLHS